MQPCTDLNRVLHVLDEISSHSSHYAECCVFDSRQRLHRFILYKWRSVCTALRNVDGNGQSIGLLLLRKVSSARLGECDIHPISPKTPATQYQPIDRKKRKGKRAEDYSRDRAT